jgi:hypothetical protein
MLWSVSHVTSINIRKVNVPYMYPCAHHCDDMCSCHKHYCSLSHLSLRTSYITIVEVLLHAKWLQLGFPEPQPIPSQGVKSFIFFGGPETS